MAGKQNWQTPRNIFAALNAEFNFAADVAADDKNHQCPVYLTEQDDALQTSWLNIAKPGDYVFMNPPYNKPAPWVEQAALMSLLGIGCVALLKLDTSTGWYHRARMTAQEIRLVTGGRLHFIDPDTGLPGPQNNFCSMFVIWHPYSRGAFQYTEVTKQSLIMKGMEVIRNAEVHHINNGTMGNAPATTK